MLMIEPAVDHFCTLLEKDQLRGLIESHTDCALNRANRMVKYSIGSKFIKITLGNSVRYFIRIADEVIFGAESFRKPNLRREFGTLQTTGQFDWSDYEGVSLPGSDYVMVQTSWPYATAVKLP